MQIKWLHFGLFLLMKLDQHFIKKAKVKKLICNFKLSTKTNMLRGSLILFNCKAIGQIFKLQ